MKTLKMILKSTLSNVGAHATYVKKKQEHGYIRQLFIFHGGKIV